MFLKLLAFEFRFHSKQMAFRIALFGFFAAGLLSSIANIGYLRSYNNAPTTIAFAIGILSLGTPIMLALFAGSAILRDHEYRMAPIIYATSMTHFQYVVSRFAGLVISGCLAFSPAILGLMLGHLLPIQDPNDIGPFRPGAYFWALLFMAWPNILFGAAIIFATAALTKNGPATYISGVFLYILYFLASILGNSPLMASSTIMSPDQAATGALMDPYGLVGLIEQISFWSLSEKNQQFLLLEGHFLFNRLLWVGLALLVFALTHRLFKFRQGMGRYKVRLEQTHSNPPTTSYQPVAIAPQRLKAQWQAFQSQTKMCFRTLVFGLPFYAFLLLWLFFIGVDTSERNDITGLDVLPLTSVLLEPLYGSILKFGALIVIFYAAELLWNERKLAMASLIDVTPVSNFILWASKVAALSTLVATFLAVTFSVTLLFQISQGVYQFHFGLYLIMTLKVGITLVMVGILAMAIQTGIPNKYAGMAVSFLLIIPFSGVILNQSPFIEHPLLRFGYSPSFIPSAMAETSFHAPATFLFIGYWVGVTGLIAWLSLRLWKRGNGLVPSGIGRAGFLTAGFFSLVFLVFGSATFVQTNVIRPYMSSKAKLDYLEHYERTYGAEMETPQLTVVGVNAQVDLFPDLRSYKIRAKLTLENLHDQPLGETLVGISNEVDHHQLQLHGAKLVDQDLGYQHYRYRFDPPLKKGEQRQLEFQGEVTRSSFQGMNRENYILARASYIELEKVLPFFGFLSKRTIQSPRLRRQRSLPPIEDYPPASEASDSDSDWITFELLVSTVHDQTVISSGDLLESWRTDDRSFFKYASAHPVPLSLGIASGVYQNIKTEVDGIEISYFFNNDQPFHAEHILDTAAKALNYGIENFGSYPHRQLKIATIPSFSDRVGGTAYPGTIFLVENRVILLNPKPNDFDAVGRIVAHETGHQWWGHQLNPAPVAGMPMLTEMLAVYTEQAVPNSARDNADSRKYLALTNDLYFFYRNFEDHQENPLVSVQFQPYIYYFKAAHVVQALSELLGEAQFNLILQQMLRDFPAPAMPVAQDFMDRLMAVAPPAIHATIRELLEEVVTYDLQLTSAKRQMGPDGLWQIELIVTAQKTRLDKAGKTLTTALEGPLEIALSQGDSQKELVSVQLDEIRQTLFITSKHPVDSILLDPRALKLEATRHDNRKSISP